MQAPDTHLLYTLGEPVALHDAVHKAAEESMTDLYAAPVALWRQVVPLGLFQAKCPIRKLSRTPLCFPLGWMSIRYTA